LRVPRLALGVQQLQSGKPLPMDKYFLRPEQILSDAGMVPLDRQTRLTRKLRLKPLLLCSGQSGPSPRRRDRGLGTTISPTFIDFISNPLQNIDPRAVTAIYPTFCSWMSPSGTAGTEDTPALQNIG
jgi:hypothetical protein